jgi:hypothetical protein
MELRLLLTEEERRTFAERMVEARATRGAGFRETEQSAVGEIHLSFGRLYGLFDEAGPNPDEMLAGFAMHNLSTFSQSYPKPDLSHLPPESVFEYGELWALAAGAARLARHGATVIAGLLQAQACLVYPIFKPWNLSTPYKNFRRVGEPIEWPYIRSLDGQKIFVQAMLLDGENLRRSLAEVWSRGFETIDHHRIVRFNNLYPISRAVSHRLARRAGIEVSHVSALNGTNRANGAAHA